VDILSKFSKIMHLSLVALHKPLGYLVLLDENTHAAVRSIQFNCNSMLSRSLRGRAERGIPYPVELGN